MNRTTRIILSIVFAILGLLFLWYFSNIVFYILAAAVISVIGRPLVDILDNLKIRRFRIPHVLSSLLTLILMIVVFVSFFSLFAPM
ncbi:MAG: AI-2E family transporter, partial [Lentimicrobium sp.]|nr:AI-2E family transporter [Lentimicrobium sp.]